jgi:tetrapyrrole methylase family protein/MazG family protein
LSEASLERLRAADKVVVPAEEGAVHGALLAEGLTPVSLADVGLSGDASADRIVESLLELARDSDVVYATSGYPFLKEGLLTGLLARTSEHVDVSPSLSPLQVILMAFDIDLTADLTIVDIESLAPTRDQRGAHLIVTGVRNPILARKAGDRLMALYPSEHNVVVAGSSAGDGFSLALATIAELEQTDVGEGAALYIPPSRILPPAGFYEFMRIIEVLRSPDGCPWDRAQDHMSLRKHMLEEAYEAVDAIERGTPDDMADELGDVLLQIALHAQIAAETGEFTIDDVVARITAKIRRRHPHVFGDFEATTPDAVHAKWDQIKRDERSAKAAEASGETTGLLDGVPKALPALSRAEKISKRAVGVGFEWESIDDVWDKFYEEIEELKETEPGSEAAAEEIGDALFTLVNVARKQGIDAEQALRGTCDKFTRRWEHMEAQAAAREIELADLDIEGLETMWKAAKLEEGTSEETG